jgi:hypothetical protein
MGSRCPHRVQNPDRSSVPSRARWNCGGSEDQASRSDSSRGCAGSNLSHRTPAGVQVDCGRNLRRFALDRVPGSRPVGYCRRDSSRSEMNGILKAAALVGAIVVGKILIDRMDTAPTIDTSWVPRAIGDGTDAFWLPPGWGKGMQHYACLGVYRDRHGKTTYLCRPRG